MPECAPHLFDEMSLRAITSGPASAKFSLCRFPGRWMSNSASHALDSIATTCPRPRSEKGGLTSGIQQAVSAARSQPSMRCSHSPLRSPRSQSRGIRTLCCQSASRSCTSSCQTARQVGHRLCTRRTTSTCACSTFIHATVSRKAHTCHSDHASKPLPNTRMRMGHAARARNPSCWCMRCTRARRRTIPPRRT